MSEGDNFDVILTKYKTAGDVAAKAIRVVIDAVTEGKTVLELIKLGDAALEEGLSLIHI